MRVTDVLAVPVRAGFFFDDQLAIRTGAGHDGFDYTGEPLIPGFRRVRQPGEAVSVLLVLDDGQVEFGDCAAVQYSGAGGRDPLFTARDAVAAVEGVVAPALRGADLGEGFRTLSERVDALPAPDGSLLHTAVRYGASQAVLAAVAHARRLTMAEVIRDEYGTGAPLLPVPLYAQTGDERYSNAEKMVLKGVDVLPHGLVNNVAEKFGASGEILADYVRWLVGRIGDLAPYPGYRPRLHLDVYGCAGLAFGGDLDAVAGYLAALGRIAEPYDLAIEHPVDAGSREGQIAAFRGLRMRLSALGSGVRIVVDEWCNTLDDVRAFVAAGAADVIHVKTPDLGSIGNTAEALLLARDAGLEAFCGGTCNETDRSAQVSAHVAMACEATQVLAKPGMGVDEGLMTVGNEMARTAALVRARETVPQANLSGTDSPVQNLELPPLDGVLASLADYVAIPSDSRDAGGATMRRAAAWIAGQLGFAGGRVEETGGHPVVRGEWLGAPGAPTVLVYGHYDVQPTGDEAEWLSPPFRLTVDGDIVRGRGASDDKGPVWLVVAMLQAAIAQRGRLPLNVKFLIEGEEEIGSPHLPGYVRDHSSELACDLVISADGAQWRPDEPSLSVASKGLVAFTITVEGARDDLHSGRYGGTVANPAQVLSAILASLHRPDGSVAVEGFYDGVAPPGAQRLAELDAVPFDDEVFAAQLGVTETCGEAGYTTLQRLWERPTLEVNGVAGGGRYTVIPHVARGFVSCRLVGDQDPQRVLAAVRAHVAGLGTRGARVTVEQDGGAVPAYRIDQAHPAIAAATDAMRAVYPGQDVLLAVIAGTLPATTLFERALGAKTLFFSFSTADEKLHAPNEFLRLRRIHEGMRAWDALLTSLADGPHRLRPVPLPGSGNGSESGNGAANDNENESGNEPAEAGA